MSHVAVDGLDAPVAIHRDNYGIPHVDASSVHDMFFGQGFACAQDRLWQMEHDRRRALGRLSELVGAAALRTDTFARRCRLADASRAGCASLDGETRAVVDAYAAGVNGFLSTSGARPVELVTLRCEPERWEGWHALAVFVVRHVGFGTWATKLFRGRVLRAFGPTAALLARREGRPGDRVTLIVPSGASAPIPRPDVDTTPAQEACALLFGRDDAVAHVVEAPLEDGSNSWALSGARTASGRPLLCGDSHRAQEVPNVYHQVHLRAPGIDCAGFAFAGFPGVPHFGHNGDVAWCVTNASADYQDVFVERFDDTGRHLDGTEWADSDVRVETVTVRDGPDVAVECWATRHGPVVIGDPRSGAAAALCSTGLLEAGSSVRCVLPLMRARDVRDAERALDGWVEPANNYTLADVSGSLLYRTAGRIPRRTKLNAWFPVPGWTKAHDWEGIVPTDALPRMPDPPGGVIATANNRIVADDPDTIGIDYAPPGRVQRLHERLRAVASATTGDMAAVHRDAVTIQGARLARDLAALPCDGDAAKARDLLASWDGSMDAGSAQAALYAELRAELARLMAASAAAIRTGSADEPPATAVALPVRLSRFVRSLTGDAGAFVLPPETSWDDTFRRALAAAWTNLSGALGDDPGGWRWGTLHRHRPVHPLRALVPELADRLTPEPVELSGDGECVLATHGQPGVSHLCTSGPVARYVFDLADRDNGGWSVPLGASGDPGSPHFADQQLLWARGELVPMLTRWEAVEAAAESTDHLSPSQPASR